MLDPLGDIRFLWPYLAVFVASFAVGSVPFGLVLTRIAGLGDIRNIGSGSIGATNVLRTGNKSLAALTLLLDAGKGAVPVLLADNFLARDPAILAAAGSFLGHLLPIWLLGSVKSGRILAFAQLAAVLGGLVLLLLSKGAMSLAGPAIMVLASWRAWGGKGVATALGVVVALSPAIGGLALAIWLTTAVITRYSSLSALIACIFGPIAAYVLAYAPIGGSYLADPQLAEFAVFLAILIVICHRDNIGRLMRGEESRINLKSPQPREGSP